MTVLENKEKIIALVIDQQYNESVDSEGVPLRAYSTPYLKHKELSGKYRGKTDFEDTGEFHATMNLAVVDDMVIIDSPSRTDKGELKSEWLTNWNGSEVMGLTPDNKELLRGELTPLFVAKLGELI